MLRIVLAVMMATVIVGVVGLLVIPPVAAQASSATRSFDQTTVEPGEEVVVTIAVANYGDTGGVSETLPTGFTYEESSLSAVRVTGQVVQFGLIGVSSFTYTVTAPSTTGTYTFNGTLQDHPRNTYTVGGASTVTVAEPSEPTPSAIRSFDQTTVEPGEVVVVTIAVANYGDTGGVSETLPTGFTYEESSLSAVRVTGQVVQFGLIGVSSFTYTVTAPSTTGTYTFNGTLQDHPRNTYTVGGASTVTVMEPPTGNVGPVFSTSTAFRRAENTRSVTTVRATDRDAGDNITGYTITGGADQGSFSLVRNTGTLSFRTAPDFENPTDAGANNTYVVAVTAASGAGDRRMTARQTITVTVTNANEDGVVTLLASQPEAGALLVASLSDPDGAVTSPAWKWASSDAMAGTFTDIAGATSGSYRPVADDVGMYLRATVMYTDVHGSGQSAMMVAGNAVMAAPMETCMASLGTLAAPVTRMGTWAGGCMSTAQTGSYARYYSFTLDSATQVEINLTSSVDAYLALRQGAGRDGTMVASNDNVGSRNPNSAINMMLAAGDYTVEATTFFAGQTGDFTLSVRPLQETEDLGTLAGSVDRSNSMWVSDYMSTQQAGSYARSYTFTVDTATHVAINLTSPEDSYLYVLDSNGAVVHESDNVTDRNLNSRIDETLAAGMYTIEATTYHPARMGAFHLSIGVLP